MARSTQLNIKEIEDIVPNLLNNLKKHADKTVEVPVNLLIVIDHFLTASRWYSDMDGGNLPYPSFENVCCLLERVIDNHMKGADINFRPNFGGEPYSIYKLLANCQTKFEAEELLKGNNVNDLQEAK